MQVCEPSPLKMSSFKSSDDIKEEEDGPYRGFSFHIVSWRSFWTKYLKDLLS